MNKLQSIWTTLQQGNVTILMNDVLKALRLFPKVWVDRIRLFIKPPPTEHDPPIRPDSRFEVFSSRDESIVPELMKCLKGTTDHAETPDELERKFKSMLRSGSVVWLARDRENEGDVAGFLWITSRRYPIQDRIVLDLPDDLTFQEFVFVNENYRRLGLYSMILQAAHAALPGLSLGSVVISYNDASIKAHLKNGFRQNGHILYLYFFGLFLASFRYGKTRRRIFRIKKGELFPITMKNVR